MTDKATPRYLWDCSTRWPIHDVTLQAITAGYTDAWSDPLSLSGAGRSAQHIWASARAAVAQLLGTREQNVCYTTSFAATVQQILTALTRNTTKPPVVAYSAIEHSHILRAVTNYHQRTGATSVIPVDALGHLKVPELAETLSEHRPGLLFCQWANAEIGTIQNLAHIAQCCREHETLLVVDASAAIGYLPPPADWDVLLAPAHAWGGPHTTTVVAHSDRVSLTAGPAGDLFTQEATPDVLASSVALQHAAAHQTQWQRVSEPAIAALRSDIAANIPQVDLPGDPKNSLPHILTASLMYCHGETLVTTLDRHGFTVGSGSACTSVTDEPSHVLAACGRLTHGNIRIGISPQSDAATLAAAVAKFGTLLHSVVAEHRAELGAPTTPAGTP